jgi:paraquat-inducible protein A
VLERTAGRSIDAALACSTATLLLLIPANVLPFLSVRMAGAVRQSVLGSGIVILWQQEAVLLSGLLAAFGLVLPIVRFGTLSLALTMVRSQHRPSWLGPAFRWATVLDLWTMPDVFLLGCAVGYSRVVAFVPVHIGAGGWCFMAPRCCR